MFAGESYIGTRWNQEVPVRGHALCVNLPEKNPSPATSVLQFEGQLERVEGQTAQAPGLTGQPDQ